MFNLKDSLTKLKSFIEQNDLKKESINVDEETLTISKNAVQKRKKKNKSKKPNKKRKSLQQDNVRDKRGVIMIKNFPHGFYEKPMWDYFSQFGEITRLKIIRSSKTGKPRNYGFIEFRFHDVAQIAAKTMNNYLMFDHIIKCYLLPEDKIQKNIFKNWNRPFISSVKKHKTTHNKIKTNKQELKSVRRHLKRLHKMEEILAKHQISFKCVVVNRPINFNKNTDNKKQNKKLSNLMDPIQSMIEEKIPMNYPKIKLSRIMNKRRMIIPKFMKLKAGLRIYI